MRVMYIILIIASIVLTVLKGAAIYKAIREEYSSVYITMFRGFTVSALLKEKEIRTDKVKKLIIINSVIDLFYIMAIVIYFYVRFTTRSEGTFYTGNFGTEIWLFIGFKFANDFITDWQLKKYIN